MKSFATLAAVLPALPLAQAFSGVFDVLAMNVAGLPELLSSGNPEVNTPEMGRRIIPYNIVNVQEDFNYHAALYAADTHPFCTSTSGGVPFGSGLNTLSDFPFVDVKRVKWNDCDLNSGDCLTPKGWTMVRVQLAAGTYIDVYNLHTDAGSNAGDLKARSSNLEQVKAAIALHSVGNAVLVYGDTNSRYTRDTIRTFTTAPANLIDVWVELVKGAPPALGAPGLVCPTPPDNNCEVVDKIFYRGSRFIKMSATSYNNEHAAFLDAKGAMLSDHDPIAATFAWSTNDDISPTDLFGGPGGTWFSDVPTFPAVGVAPARVTSLTISGGNRIDRISYSLSNGATYTRGGSGGNASTLTLAAGESIVAVNMHKGTYNDTERIFWMQVTTSTGRTLAVGKQTGNSVSYSTPAGFTGLIGFQGSAADNLDKVSFIWGKY